MYTSLTLWEHPVIIDLMSTLTKVISCIFSLDITDGQSEVRSRSTAPESVWNTGLSTVNVVDQEFRSFSRFLLKPGQLLIIPSIGHISAGSTVDGD